MRDITDVNMDALQHAVMLLSEKPFRAQQIFNWIYKKGCTNFGDMTNLTASFKEKIAGIFSLNRPRINCELLSRDGTAKWVLRMEDSNEIETVFIPEKTRSTICVSSQVGCTLTCKFCHTGTQPLVRNLTAGEIVSQVLLVKDYLNDWSAISSVRKLSNIVFMGMGEPMLNYDAVKNAIIILTNPSALNFSKKRITISTSGFIPQIEKCGQELGVRLAISLHAVRDELRDYLVPINKKYPIRQLLDACRQYALLTNMERITFEYVMLDSVNDTDADARELVTLLKGIPAKVNLIPFNPWPNTEFKCSSKERIAKFASIIEKAGYKSPVRVTRGQDIMAACGQLKSTSIKINRSKKDI